MLRNSFISSSQGSSAWFTASALPSRAVPARLASCPPGRGSSSLPQALRSRSAARPFSRDTTSSLPSTYFRLVSGSLCSAPFSTSCTTATAGAWPLHCTLPLAAWLYWYWSSACCSWRPLHSRTRQKRVRIASLCPGRCPLWRLPPAVLASAVFRLGGVHAACQHRFSPAASVHRSLPTWGGCPTHFTCFIGPRSSASDGLWGWTLRTTVCKHWASLYCSGWVRTTASRGSLDGGSQVGCCPCCVPSS